MIAPPRPQPIGNSQPLAFIFAVFLLGNIARGQETDFERQVRPILSKHCFHCHGPDEAERQADLRLDDGAWIQSTSDGEEHREELLARITSTDDSYVMPPADSHDSLDEEEIAIVTGWIRSGAAWSPHWAFLNPQPKPTPAVKDPHWANNFIDDFVLARIEAQGLSPSEDADAVTLLRRLSFDLTGLPPQPEWEKLATDFLESRQHAIDADSSLERLVDHLLASPHFGERMAVYWLDLVRYADTVGYHGDQDHNASPYRDWVIKAFNDGMPFDQFTIEQLAGDLLPEPTQSQLVATAYNRLLQTSHEGGIQPAEYRAIYAADRVRNLTSVWMAATVGCAQCHDHKYDPYTIVDFYSLAAFFADVDDERHFKNGSNSLPTRRDPELELPTQQQAQQRSELNARITQLKSLIEAEQDAPQQKSLTKKLQQAQRELKQLESSVRRCMITQALESPREVKVLPRGDWLDDSGTIVSPAVPAFLGPLNSSGRATRLDLARWLVDPEQGRGLPTARIMVNRIWYLFFGAGLSDSLDDFGNQGSPPTHPELLDRLACELVNNHWNLKWLVRQIVLSRTYQQSSAWTETLKRKDPENRLLARQSAFRLPAEMVRDNALSVSGLLVKDVGGPSVKPYQPAGYYRHLNFPTRKYKADTDERRYQRGLYVHWQRQFLHPMLKAFDAPSREECTAKRAQSNTPLAALTLLNDPTFLEAAEALAVQALQQDHASDQTRLQQLWRTVLQRSASQAEVDALTALLKKERRSDESTSHRADQQTNTTELAAWISVCRVLLNLAETNMRN